MDALDTETTLLSLGQNWLVTLLITLYYALLHERITKYGFTCVFVIQVKVLLGHRVIQVACGSRDAQTLALTDEGISVKM